MPWSKSAFAQSDLWTWTEATFWSMSQKPQAHQVSQVFGCWWDGDTSSKAVPHTVVDAAGTPRQDSPPRYAGGGGEMQGEQLVPHSWFVPHQQRGLQSFARLRLIWLSILVWKNLPVTSSQWLALVRNEMDKMLLWLLPHSPWTHCASKWIVVERHEVKRV